MVWYSTGGLLRGDVIFVEFFGFWLVVLFDCVLENLPENCTCLFGGSIAGDLNQNCAACRYISRPFQDI